MDGKEWEQTSCGRRILRKRTASVLITQLKMEQSCNSKKSKKEKKRRKKSKKEKKTKTEFGKQKKEAR